MENIYSPILAQKVQSVSRRFSYFLIGVVTLIMLVFTAIAVLVNSDRIDAELERRLDNALKLCNISLTTPLWRLEIDTVDNFINALFLDESIVFAEIVWGGKIVSKRVREKFQKNSATYFEQSSQFIVKTSDILYEGTNVGSMLLAMSREIIKKELLFNILSIIGLTILITVAISVTSIIMTGRYISRPLMKLQKSAAKIAQGDLEAHIDTSNKYEIGNLAKDLNVMRESIKNLFSELRDNSRTLEQKVDERTRQLALSVEELKALGEVSQAVSSTLDLETVLTSIVRHAVQFSKADAGTIYGFDEAEGVFIPRINYGLSAEFIEAIRKSGLRVGDKTVIGQAALKRAPTQVPDLVNVADYPLSYVQQAGFRALLAVPLLREDRLIGGLIVRRKAAGEFPAPVVNLLQTFAAQSVLAINNARLFQEIEEKGHELEIANKHKSEFLANMSHELRTPMNAIIGMNHLALKTELTPKQHDYLSKIQLSAHSLLVIINDILDFSKIEAGKLDMESVDFNLEDVLDNLRNLITVKAQEKEEIEVLFAMASEVPRLLVGDPLRLGQILINLTNNAIKFTESGEIVVSTELVTQDEDRVTLKFSVSDTGVGLTRQQVTKLFQAFSQADTSTTRKYGGTGLGLTISKRLVDMMRGEIWVESEPGKGSTFMFTATFGRGRKKEEKRFRPSPELQGMKVLVVDDNPTSREILQEILESFSFAVTLAASGEEGLAELENASEANPFDLVIMDYKMPGMDGIEASNHIKRHPHLDKIPAIVMVTNYGREEIIQKAEDVGLDGFLIKPVSPSVLFDAIMQAVGKDVPKRSRAAQEKAREAEVLQYIRGARVLLVEDNEINQQVAHEILVGAGVNVSLVNHGQEAVEAVKENEYDAVLMDVQMPVMDGYEATRIIRSDPRFRELPIIAMTAHAMTGDREKSLEAGMNDHVTKPIDPDQLFTTLLKWVQSVERRYEPAPTEEPDADPDVDVDLPEDLPGIDMASGLTRVGGNQKLFLKLLAKFSLNHSKAVDEISQALADGDSSLGERLAHTVKGVSGNIGAKDVHMAAHGLEMAIKNGKMDDVEGLLGQLTFTLEQVLASIASLYQDADISALTEKKQQEEDTVLNISEIKPILIELAALLKKNDMEAADRIEALRKHLGNTKLASEVTMFEKRVGQYDFEKALECLTEMAQLLAINLEEEGDEK